MTVEQILGHLIEQHTENPDGNEESMCRLLHKELTIRHADKVETTLVPRTKTKCSNAYVFATFGKPELLINAHIDTVPANSGWTRDPWKPVITEDKVIGLGATDTKGAIAAILIALEAVTPHNTGILFSGDEENGTTCIKSFVNSPQIKGIQRAIVCEPTNRYAGSSHRGISAYHANLSGKGGHSSNADYMQKPISTLSHLAIELDNLGQKYLTQDSGNAQGICMNIAALDGGVAFNVVPDEGTLTWSIRPPHSFKYNAFNQKVESIIKNVNPDILLTCFLNNPPFSTMHLQEFEKTIGSHVLGFVPLEFWTEAAIISEAEVNAIVIGPGNIAQAHSADEWISRKDLQWAVDLFIDIFKSTHK